MVLLLDASKLYIHRLNSCVRGSSEDIWHWPTRTVSGCQPLTTISLINDTTVIIIIIYSNYQQK